jgi:hypothetical protein
MLLHFWVAEQLAEKAALGKCVYSTCTHKCILCSFVHKNHIIVQCTRPLMNSAKVFLIFFIFGSLLKRKSGD